MLTFRSDLSGNPRFVDFLKQVRDTAWGAYAHQDLPFDKLVEELHPDRQLSRTPLVQVTFGFQNAPKNYLELPGLRISGLDFERQTGRFDLTLWMSEIGGQLQGIWTYLKDLFEPEVIRRMSAHLEILLNSIVERPEARLNALEHLTEAEKEQSLSEKRELKKQSRDRFKNVRPKAVLLSE
jgi:non-ribosomal peptide synthetase component F